DEIISIVHEIFTENDKAAISLVDSFCRLTPPEKEKFVMEYITVNSSGRRGGKSRKLGNFVLNWRKLFNDLPDLVLTAAGVAAEPKLVFFAALSIWNKIWCHSSIELTPEHATVLYALWQGRDEYNKIKRDDAFAKSGIQFNFYGMQELVDISFDDIIDDLIKMRCIEVNDNIIWLREWVSGVY
ncbi:hypothetical protein ABG174_004787, partial [Salmonella enterica subsp. enterica serovar Derby]|nr:hypothetical protein [Salmonella enterica subsp. enterica serovar Derby]EJM0060063.1 hypothetical protein [Salmonella enterica subsp. enterica serovar Derby]